MNARTIKDIFADLDVGEEANDALEWNPKSGDIPIIVGTVISATVARPEGKQTSVSLSVRNHEGATKRVFCPAVLGRGICGHVGLDWTEFKASEPTEELRATVGAIAGRFICIQYLGREDSEKRTHLYNVFITKDPTKASVDFVQTAFEKLRAELPPELWAPVEEREAKITGDSDL